MLRFALIGSGVLLGFAIASIHPLSTRPVFAQQDQAQAPNEAGPTPDNVQPPAAGAAPAVGDAPHDVDGRLNKAVRDIDDLRSLVVAQASRITSLERTVRSLQDQLTTPAGNRWRTAEGWAEIRLNMSRTDVENILGPPTNVDSVIDRQTLTWGSDAGIVGTVILVDDRVAHVEAPGFKIVQPEPGR